MSVVRLNENVETVCGGSEMTVVTRARDFENMKKFGMEEGFLVKSERGSV